MEKIIRTFNISGHELWTEGLGDRRHPAILLISGAVAHARFWTNLFCEELVRNGYFVIRYDHRDVGLSSSDTQEPYTIEDLSRDAATILQEHGISKAHIVGHSMGGIVAQIFAIIFPEKTLTLTCIGCGPAAATDLMDIPLTSEEQKIVDLTREINNANKPTEHFEESLPGFMQMWKRWNGTAAFDEDLVYDFTKEMYSRSIKKNRDKPHPHIKAIRAGVESLEERRGILKNIRGPVLVIQGEEDYLLIPRRGGIALAQELPQAQLKLIPTMGHMFFNKDLQMLLAHLILDFLKFNE